MVLIGNYNTDTPQIWVDYTNDLYFSGDNEPISFSNEFANISIPNRDHPGLAHNVRLHKLDSEKKAELKEMIERYITKGERYSGFFTEQRRNIRIGDFVYEGDSLSIGLMDWDVNGVYNDRGTDRIVNVEYDGAVSSDKASGAVVLDSATRFRAGTHHFKVIEAAEDGTYILIKPTSADDLFGQITKGSAVPDYTFELISGDETALHDYLNGERYLYLNFWASWCAGCRHEVGYLKEIHSDYRDRIKIISFNYNEAPMKTKAFIDRYNITWLNGYATQEINEALFIEGLPRNILIDPAGKIIEQDIHPNKLLKKIDENPIQSNH